MKLIIKRIAERVVVWLLTRAYRGLWKAQVRAIEKRARKEGWGWISEIEFYA